MVQFPLTLCKSANGLTNENKHYVIVGDSLSKRLPPLIRIGSILSTLTHSTVQAYRGLPNLPVTLLNAKQIFS